MSNASTSAFGVSSDMRALSQNVTNDASIYFHNLCVPCFVTECDNTGMEDKNGGPNYLRAWRTFRELTQEQLAEAVGTNANMIQYLETGERGLSAKWLRRLAPALKTTPGMLLDHDPAEVEEDVVDLWLNAGKRARQQISEIAKTLMKTEARD